MKELSTSKDQWLKIVRPGSRVFIGSGAAVPHELIRRFLEVADQVGDVEVVHIHTLGDTPWVEEKYAAHLRTNSFYVTPEVGQAILEGRADYTPISMSAIPGLFHSMTMPIDVALIMTTPPNEQGLVSLGVSVDVVRAALDNARVVIAQINPDMPWTNGDGVIPTSKIDWFVECATPLDPLLYASADPARQMIGKYLAELVDDGSTLQVGLGLTPQIAVSALIHHKNLGIHSGMFSDVFMDLIKAGAVDHSRKHFMTGKAIASHVLGSQELYDFIKEYRQIELRTSDWVNSSAIIAMNHRMVAVNGARLIDLTGQVMRDATGHRFHGGIGAQIDFLHGAAGSAGGRPVHVLLSKTDDGEESRIVAAPPEGAMVATGRTDTDYVITEHGVARLRGKNMRERALEMIQVADPKFREELLRAAHQRGWIPKFVSIPPSNLRNEPNESEPDFARLRLGDGTRPFFIRPLRVADMWRLQEFFYSHSEETIQNRYGYLRKSMSEDAAYRMVGVDQNRDLALGIFEEMGAGREAKLRAVGRFYREETEPVAEVALVVHDETRRMGIAGVLFKRLAEIAQKRNIVRFWATVRPDNNPMRRLFEKYGGTAKRKQDEVLFDLPIAVVLERAGEFDLRRSPTPKVQTDQVAIGWHWSPLCLEHDGGPDELENPQRYRVLGDVMKKLMPELPHSVELPGRTATRPELLRCHAAYYLDIVHIDVDNFADRLRTGDTALCPASEKVAQWAVGSALQAVEAVMTGRVQRAFVAVRPPGHHATADRGMGFCIYNNVALMARHAQELYGVQRVLIVDWDVHHGNGTQDIFFSDPNVFYFSVHEQGIFPFSGAVEETGAGRGCGTTLNVPLPGGSTAREILAAFEDQLSSAMESFRPNLVLISAGFDTLESDPIGGFRLQPEDFSLLTQSIVRIANRWAEGRIVSVLEGGYDPEGLARAVSVHIKALAEP